MVLSSGYCFAHQLVARIAAAVVIAHQLGLNEVTTLSQDVDGTAQTVDAINTQGLQRRDAIFVCTQVAQDFADARCAASENEIGLLLRHDVSPEKK